MGFDDSLLLQFEPTPGSSGHVHSSLDADRLAESRRGTIPVRAKSRICPSLQERRVSDSEKDNHAEDCEDERYPDEVSKPGRWPRPFHWWLDSTAASTAEGPDVNQTEHG